MTTNIEELKRKYRKVAFLLGELIYKLKNDESVRFLYTSDGVEDEKEVERLLRE